MKRVKVMLMAILVLAIAGGTLAFKAKFGEIAYCTVAPIDVAGVLTCTDVDNPDGRFCPEFNPNLTTSFEEEIPTLVCTTEEDLFGCEGLRCPAGTLLITAED